MSAPTITRIGSGLPTRVVFHGVEGIGKTSFAAYAPSPIFGMTRGETGLLTLIDAGQIPETEHFESDFQTWAELLGAVRHLRDQHTDHKTFVLDTLNGAERLCLEHVCREQFDDSWAAFASYGRGVEQSQAEWHKFLSLLDQLRERRRMAVILLCHTKVKPFRNPLGEDFDRYAPDMNDKFWGLSAKWADVILFGNFDVKARKEKGSLKAKATEAEAVSRRVLHTVRTAAWDAKNRTGLPAQIGMGANAQQGWTAFRDALKKARPQPKPAQQEAAAAEATPPRARPTEADRADPSSAPGVRSGTPGAPKTADAERPATEAPARQGKALPADGPELRKRLYDHDHRLEKQGLCKPGALVEHVRAAGVKASYGPDLSAWAGPAILLAVEETKAFEQKARADLARAREAVRSYLGMLGWDEARRVAWLKDGYGVDSLEQLTARDARGAAGKLRQALAEAQVGGVPPDPVEEVERQAIRAEAAAK